MNIARAAEIVLRAVLLVSAFGWGISVFAVAMPPEVAFAHLERLSGRDVEPTPALSYWLKLAGVGFAFLGLQFAFCAVRPDRLMGLTKALLVFNLVCGAVLVWAALSVGLEPGTFIYDVTFCATTGGFGLIALRLREPRVSESSRIPARAAEV